MKPLLPPDPQAQLVPRSASPDAYPVRPYPLDGPDAATRVGPPSGGLLEYWRIIQRHKGTLVFICFLGGLAACLYTFPQTPVYQARATMEVQGLNENFLNLRDVNPTVAANSGWYPEYDLQTQVRILQSRTLLERVNAKLKNHPRPLAPAGSRLEAWRRALGLPNSKPPAQAAADVRVRAQANTRILEILTDSTDPQFAADFANTLASEFIEDTLEARWKSVQHTGEWLARQMEDLKIKLERSEEELQSYARVTGLMFTAEKENLADQRLKQLQEELSRAQADRIAKQSKFEIASRSAPDTLPDVLDDTSLRDYKSRLADLRRQQSELTSTFTSAHPRVKRVEAQIASLQSALASESGNIVRRIRNEFEAARRRESLLAADYANQARLMSEQADKVTHYNILKREVDTIRQLYDNMLQRVKEAGIASALRASNVRIVDAAVPPAAPYKPDLFNNTVFGLLVGFFLGLGFIVLRDRADRTIQEPGDAAFYLGVPELGLIPSAVADPLRGRRLLSVSSASPQSDSDSLAMVTWERKPCAMAESFRSAITSILFTPREGERPHVVVLASPAPKEGKTTILTNLGIAMAEINERVLLIDADLRKPRLHHVFDLPNDVGLGDLLRRKEALHGSLNGAIRPTSVPGLSVLTSGPSGESDTALLYSARLSELIKALRQQFDTILIDTPPMLTMADARVIGRFADAVILVARANQTSRDAIQAALRRFLEDGTPVLGTILNDWNPKRSSRYGYYRYYDRYKHYYGKSHDSDESR
jgi:capsular exopolysaccharide synthesis family protein